MTETGTGTEGALTAISVCHPVGVPPGTGQDAEVPEADH